jgi:AraC-like DNA-binding protein
MRHHINQFAFEQGHSEELAFFPHIKEFSLSKNSAVRLDSFAARVSEDLRIYCVVDGKFEWLIDNQQYTLYPGDLALVMPGSQIGGANGVLDIGTVFRLHIQIENLQEHAGGSLGRWSGLTGADLLAVLKALSASNVHIITLTEGPDILDEIRSELQEKQIGYLTRVNHLIDSLFITVARQSTRQSDSRSDFSRTFMKLEQALRHKPAHQWTVEEMAAMFGLGTTAFTEKVKRQTGFSPMNYLINIRISEAIKLLRGSTTNFTSIALETGFYSSQHFSTTFKKLTGYTPGEFRKRNVLDDRLTTHG